MKATRKMDFSVSKEEILSLVSGSNASDLLTANPWMNLPQVNALASLSALIQNTEAGTSVGAGLCNPPLTEELRISTDERKLFDSSKFLDMRNVSLLS